MTDAKAESPRPLPSNKVTIAYLQDACRTLIDFASARIAIPDTVITEASHLLRLDPADVSEDQETRLRLVHRTLTMALRPATEISIRAVRELEEDRRLRPRLFRFWWKDNEARKQISNATWLMLAILLVLVVIQVYTLVLSTCVQRLTEISADRATIALEIEAAKKAAAASRGNVSIDPIDAVPDTLLQRKEIADSRYSGFNLLLVQWSKPWSWAVVDGKVQGEDVQDTRGSAVQHSVREAAEAVLRALALYVLPLIYGLLGANAYILRAISRQIDDHALVLLTFYKYRLRLALGALLGASVSLIFTSDAAATQGIGLSMTAVAFLSGYSVEFAFSIIDALIHRGRIAVGADSKPSAVPPPAGGGVAPGG